jgi:hypothetical protein
LAPHAGIVRGGRRRLECIVLAAERTWRGGHRDRPTVTPEFFEVLRTAPALGRPFTPSDEVDGQHRRVILSHGFWQSAHPSLLVGAGLAIGALAAWYLTAFVEDFLFEIDTRDVRIYGLALLALGRD